MPTQAWGSPEARAGAARAPLVVVRHRAATTAATLFFTDRNVATQPPGIAGLRGRRTGSTAREVSVVPTEPCPLIPGEATAGGLVMWARGVVGLRPALPAG